MTCEDTRNATSSPAMADGPSQLDLLDGPTIDLSGPPRVHVSRSARPAKGEERMIQGICGRTYFDSSAPAGPPSLWASRLAERLAMVGSTESALIWRRKDTPARQSIFRLAPSTRHTNGTGFTGSHWPTAQARDGMPPHSAAYIAKHKARGHGMANLNDYLALTAHWVTPSARDWKDSPGMATQAGDRSRTDLLPRQMIATALAYMPTPTLCGDYNRKGASDSSGDGLATVMIAATALSGPAPNGSPATTGKRGAPNPAFAMWLMGMSDELIAAMIRAVQSRPKSRKGSL